MATKEDWNKTRPRFDVTEFLRKIRGTTYLSKFYFEIEPNFVGNIEQIMKSSRTQNLLNANNKINLKDIFFYSQGITIPSRGLNTENYTYSNGFRAEMPTGSNFGDGNISIPIMSDDKYTLYDFFITWMDKIHSKETGFFAFYDDYVTNLTIKQLDYRATSIITDSLKDFHDNLSGGTGETVFGVQLVNCYPRAVSAIEFRHDNKERVEFNVNISYEGIEYII